MGPVFAHYAVAGDVGAVRLPVIPKSTEARISTVATVRPEGLPDSSTSECSDSGIGEWSDEVSTTNEHELGTVTGSAWQSTIVALDRATPALSVRGAASVSTSGSIEDPGSESYAIGSTGNDLEFTFETIDRAAVYLGVSLWADLDVAELPEENGFLTISLCTSPRPYPAADCAYFFREEAFSGDLVLSDFHDDFELEPGLLHSFVVRGGFTDYAVQGHALDALLGWRFTLDIAPVPEPTPGLLQAAAIAALLCLRRWQAGVT